MPSRKLVPDSIYARLFLFVTLLEALVDIGLESAIIAQTDLLHDGISQIGSKTLRPLAVYLGIFILAHLFQLCLAWDALTLRNTIQVIGLCCFNGAFLIYAIIQVSEIKEIEQGEPNTPGLRIPLVIIPIVISVCQIAFCYLSWHIFKEFGWQIYKQIGADRRMKRMFLIYQIFICLLKFDYFFFISFCLQLVLLVPSVGSAERILTIVAVPATLLLLVIGYLAVRHENRWATAGFMAGLVAGSGYFGYKLFRIWQRRSDPNSYGNVFKSLTVFSALCLMMSVATFAVAWFCLRNFDRGLKASMSRRSGSRKELEGMDGMGMHYSLESANNSRMSID